MMDSGHGKKRRNNKVKRAPGVDRLSSLPNDLIHKILSNISIRDVVQTIDVLSSRYRFIWTTMPYLNFSIEDFPRGRRDFSTKKFSKFVRQFLKRRDSRVDVSSLKFSFLGKITLQQFVKKLLAYAFSHNIQRLEVTCLIDNFIAFPLSLFSSMSLKHLSLEGERYQSHRAISGKQTLLATSNLELPALTTLCLRNVTFSSDDKCVGFFSKCANLKNLTLKSCEMIIKESSSSFSICHHPGLSNLTLEGLQGVKAVNVVAPQLENLIIRECNYIREHVISAPGLTSLVYDGYHPLHLSTDHGFPSLKEANICYSDRQLADAAHEIVCLLQQLCTVEILTLNLEIIELLLSSGEQISHQPSPFVNLKSLTIYPRHLHERGLPERKVNLSTEVKNYLLNSSPGATFTMISREELIAMEDATAAQKLMAELRVLLEQEKANTKTKRKAPMESDSEKMRKKRKAQAEMQKELQLWGNSTFIKNCWDDLNMQFLQSKAKAFRITSMLESIEKLLEKLPAKNRAMIQPCFSGLCVEIDRAMSKMTDCLKMQSDENQSRLSFCFNELAASS